MHLCHVGAQCHPCIGDDGSQDLFVEVQDGLFLFGKMFLQSGYQYVDSWFISVRHFGGMVPDGHPRVVGCAEGFCGRRYWIGPARAPQSGALYTSGAPVIYPRSNSLPITVSQHRVSNRLSCFLTVSRKIIYRFNSFFRNIFKIFSLSHTIKKIIFLYLIMNMVKYTYVFKVTI